MDIDTSTEGVLNAQADSAAAGKIVDNERLIVSGETG
jgi:hypothetical protein